MKIISEKQKFKNRSKTNLRKKKLKKTCSIDILEKSKELSKISKNYKNNIKKNKIKKSSTVRINNFSYINKRMMEKSKKMIVSEKEIKKIFNNKKNKNDKKNTFSKRIHIPIKKNNLKNKFVFQNEIRNEEFNNMRKKILEVNKKKKKKKIKSKFKNLKK